MGVVESSTTGIRVFGGDGLSLSNQSEKLARKLVDGYSAVTESGIYQSGSRAMSITSYTKPHPGSPENLVMNGLTSTATRAQLYRAASVKASMQPSSPQALGRSAWA